MNKEMASEIAAIIRNSLGEKEDNLFNSLVEFSKKNDTPLKEVLREAFVAGYVQGALYILTHD